MGERCITRLGFQLQIGYTLLILVVIRRDRILNGSTDRLSRTDYHGEDQSVPLSGSLASSTVSKHNEVWVDGQMGPWGAWHIRCFGCHACTTAWLLGCIPVSLQEMGQITWYFWGQDIPS